LINIGFAAVRGMCVSRSFEIVVKCGFVILWTLKIGFDKVVKLILRVVIVFQKKLRFFYIFVLMTKKCFFDFQHWVTSNVKKVYNTVGVEYE
jgi:hypothetical protein